MAAASSGSRVRRERGSGMGGAVDRAPAAGRWAGITSVTSSAGITWVTSALRPVGIRTRETTTWRVRSRERSYVAAATAETTDPTAAPTTVPSAPKEDPTTAVVAAAPAPATTLLRFRLPFGPPERGRFGGASRNDELMTSGLSDGARADVSQPCVLNASSQVGGLVKMLTPIP